MVEWKDIPEHGGPDAYVVPGPVCDPEYAKAMGKIWFWNEVKCACSLVCVVASGLSLLGCVFSMLAYDGNLMPLGVCISIGGVLSFLLMCLRGWAGYRTDKAVEDANRMHLMWNSSDGTVTGIKEVVLKDEA